MRERKVLGQIFEKDDELGNRHFERVGRIFIQDERVWRAVENPFNIPDIMCECSGFTFEIRREDYDTFARCVSCKREARIHSG